MKITSSELKQIIKEEYNALINETTWKNMKAGLYGTLATDPGPTRPAQGPSYGQQVAMLAPDAKAKTAEGRVKEILSKHKIENPILSNVYKEVIEFIQKPEKEIQGSLRQDTRELKSLKQSGIFSEKGFDFSIGGDPLRVASTVAHVYYMKDRLK